MNRLTELPIVRWFLPPSLVGSDQVEARCGALLLVYGLVIILAAGPFSYIFTFQLGLPRAGLTAFAGIFMILFGMSLVRFTNNLTVASHWMSFTLFVTVSSVSFFTGGIASPGIVWYMLCPIYVFLFSGFTGGLFWSGLILIAGIAFFAAGTTPPSFSNHLSIVDQQWFYLTSYMGLNLAVIGYLSAYRFYVTDYQIAKLDLRREKEREARQRAQEANQAKTQFLANTSHEIRTPLNAIMSMINLLRESDLSEEYREYLDMGEESAHQLNATIDDLLDISRIEVGSVDLKQQPFRIREVVVDVLRKLSPEATEKELDVILKVQPDVPDHLEGDEKKIRQVLSNLVTNAIKYTPEGQIEVVIECETLADHTCELHVCVRDTGVGIEEGEQQKIFETFQRSSHPLMQETRGTGLGLSICKKLVELMGGEIWVESTLEEGSTFHFTVECTIEESAPQPPEYQTDNVEGTPVLVVSAYETSGKVIMNELKRWGMEPVISYQMKDVSNELRGRQNEDDPVQLMLIDQCPSNRETEGVINEIHELNVQIPPVIRLHQPGSSTGDPDETRTAGTVQKPIAPSELLKTIKDVLVMQTATNSVDDTTDPPDQNGGAASKDILFAEDNDPVRNVVTMQLTELGHDVQPVENGQEVLDHVQGEAYDLILMDVQMPELDGIEATRQIREMDEPVESVPIVAFTALARSEDRKRCLDAGMNGYISKPPGKEELEEVILQHAM